MAKTKTKTHEIAWAELLKRAVDEPGSMLKAYSNFHSYSLGNCILAYFQAHERGLDFGPIATYKKWNELGRQVRRGQKAITLCQPVLINRKDAAGNIERNENGEPEKRRIFIYRNRWFFLSQTDGDELTFETGPDFDKGKALGELGITEEKFAHGDGNVQGYARGKTIAINPVAELPHKTLFHELAHIVLGHTEDERFTDGENLSRNLREAEAESVALLCLDALGLDGQEFCRGYIQGWLKGSDIPEKSASRIFAAAHKILSAGAVTAVNDNSEAA